MGNPLFDAQSTLGFVVNQTSIIEPGVYATRYASIQYRDLIPVDTSGSEFATSVTYYSSDRFGEADWINGNADDIPKAGTVRSRFETPVYTAGIGYGYGWEEVGRAMMLGINLQADDAAAARRASEEMVDRVALLGDTSKGFLGLFDNPNVAVNVPTNGDWLNPATTGDQIAADINAGLANVFSGTNTVALADRLILPWTHWNHIATKRMDANGSNMTVLQYIMLHNIYTAQTGRPLMIRGSRGLDTIGQSGNARMIAYRYAPEVLKLHMPMPHRFLPVWQSGPLRWDVPGVMRLGGLDIRLPKEGVYVDGI
jgi:hypothetical protein